MTYLRLDPDPLNVQPTPAPRKRTEARPLSEKDWQRQVVDLARLFGWDFIYHAQLAKWSEKGWPDLVLVRVRDRRLIFAELKADRGKLTDRQEVVLGFLRAIQSMPDFYTMTSEGGVSTVYPMGPRIEVAVWRPADIDAVQAALR